VVVDLELLAVDLRTKMSDNDKIAWTSEKRITTTFLAMRGNELIKKVEALGKERGSPSGSTRSAGREVIKRFISENGRPSFATRRTN
jgi:hypothetical protein